MSWESSCSFPTSYLTDEGDVTEEPLEEQPQEIACVHQHRKEQQQQGLARLAAAGRYITNGSS